MATEFSFPDPAAKVASAEFETEKMSLSMGPSHPSTHGVLRLQLELDGEIVTKCDPVIGYLHRGDEKIAENMTYNQFVPYTDRLDYLAPLANNMAYAIAVERRSASCNCAVIDATSPTALSISARKGRPLLPASLSIRPSSAVVSGLSARCARQPAPRPATTRGPGS